jgi:hypothetical protein
MRKEQNIQKTENFKTTLIDLESNVKKIQNVKITKLQKRSALAKNFNPIINGLKVMKGWHTRTLQKLLLPEKNSGNAVVMVQGEIHDLHTGITRYVENSQGMVNRRTTADYRNRLNVLINYFNL